MSAAALAEGAGGVKRVSLALQGGGSHGAFTWGVLDALLEDERLEFDAITGASAGAMNAVVLAEGFCEGGRQGARDALDRFWRSLSSANALSPVQRKLFDTFFGYGTPAAAIGYFWADLLTHFASPYDLNPLNLNPLREHLAAAVDFEKVRTQSAIKLFVAATNVESGQIKIFEKHELTADHIMASACLPFVFQAVEIDGVPYWDGGYRGNPALFPLFYKTTCPDIVLVQVNPIARKGVPRSAQEIQSRLNEITFNGALMSEMRAVDFVTKLIDAGKLSREEYMRAFLHSIDGGEVLRDFSAASKLDASWPLLSQLRGFGRSAAQAWLKTNFDAIGRVTTLDLRVAFV